MGLGVGVCVGVGEGGGGGGWGVEVGVDVGVPGAGTGVELGVGVTVAVGAGVEVPGRAIGTGPNVAEGVGVDEDPGLGAAVGAAVGVGVGVGSTAVGLGVGEGSEAGCGDDVDVGEGGAAVAVGVSVGLEVGTSAVFWPPTAVDVGVTVSEGPAVETGDGSGDRVAPGDVVEAWVDVGEGDGDVRGVCSGVGEAGSPPEDSRAADGSSSEPFAPFGESATRVCSAVSVQAPATKAMTAATASHVRIFLIDVTRTGLSDASPPILTRYERPRSDQENPISIQPVKTVNRRLV